MTLRDVAASGDRRATLEALRDFLAAQLDAGDYPPAPIAQRLADVLREIDDLPDAKARSTVDDLVARRAARGAAPKGGKPAASG